MISRGLLSPDKDTYSVPLMGSLQMKQTESSSNMVYSARGWIRVRVKSCKDMSNGFGKRARKGEWGDM